VANAGDTGGDALSYKASNGVEESSSTPTNIQIGFPEHAVGEAVPRRRSASGEELAPKDLQQGQQRRQQLQKRQESRRRQRRFAVTPTLI